VLLMAVPPTLACVSGRRVLTVAAGMGIRTVLLDEQIPVETAFMADVPVEVDLDDWQTAEAALRHAASRHRVDAVLSVRDSRVPLAGYLASRLGVGGLALHAALNCHDKARMRSALQGAGLPGPRYAVAQEPREALRLGEHVGFPLVLKRTRGAGGTGVRLCHDANELNSAVTALSDAEMPVELLAEQYLAGPEYAVQTVTTGTGTEILSVLAEHIGPPPRFAEIGYDHPCGLGPDRRGMLCDHVVAALGALGVDCGVAHVQVRLTGDGPRIIEVNPRPPGGLLAHVTEIVSGVDMVQAAIEAALDRPISRREPAADYIRYRCVVFDRTGFVDFDEAVLAEFEDIDDLAVGPVLALDVDRGDLVLPVEHPDGGAYGRLVVAGGHPAEVDRRYRDILDRLRLRIDDNPLPAPSNPEW